MRLWFLLLIVGLVRAGQALQMPYVCRFSAPETSTKGRDVITHTIDIMTCPEARCRGLMVLSIPTTSLKSLEGWWMTNPTVCLTRDQRLFSVYKGCDWQPEVYGGCPYKHCCHHTTRMGKRLKIPIWDPDSKDWETGVREKIYVNLWHSGPIGDIFIFKAYEPKDPKLVGIYNCTSSIQSREESLASDLGSSTQTGPFSWLTLLRDGARLLNLTAPADVNNCFLCASLEWPPIAAVPIPTPLNITANPVSFSIPGVPLFQNEAEAPPVCYRPEKTCNLTIPIGLEDSPAHLGLSSGAMGPCTIRPATPTLCYPTILTPQLMQYQEGELHSLLTSRREKRAVLLPVLVGLSFTTSLIGAGVGGAGLAHSIQTNQQLKEELEKALDAIALSLASLQRQITSLARVTLQNCRALDLLTEEKRRNLPISTRTVLLLYYESGVVEENIYRLQDIQNWVKSIDQTPLSAPWWQFLVYSVLAPVIGPLLILFLIITLGLCLIRTLTEQIRMIEARVATAKILSLQRHHYQRLQPGPGDAMTEESSV